VNRNPPPRRQDVQSIRISSTRGCAAGFCSDIGYQDVQIRWQTPVDLQPQYSGAELLIHYGSPVAASLNTVIVPVKTGATGGFRVDAHAAGDGSLIWSLPSDYILPANDWTPEFGPTLTTGGPLVYGYFDALVRMFEQALMAIAQLSASDRHALFARLEKVRAASHNFGYGVGDDMDSLLAKYVRQ
jgi:hypothetical protein